MRNYSEGTVEHRETRLRAFIAWCDERGVTHPQEVTRPVLERYQRYLFLYRKKNGEALSGRSQHMRLVPVKVWFRWLVRNHRIQSNPAADIDMPRVEKRLPRHVLSADEAERILNVPDVTSSLGIRDRAMLETFYSEHAQLTSTQIYTQVAIRALKEIHTATHPARLERREEAERIEQTRPTRLLKRVYGQKEA